MKKFSLLLIFFYFSASQFSFSQIKFSKGVEIGVNCSGIPWRYNHIIAVRNDHVKETYFPLVSPVLGLWANTKFGKHFLINLGVQYFWAGDKYHYHRDGNNLLDSTTYKDDEWKNMTFHKLSIPISIGYDFKIRKIKATVLLGYKKTYLLNGSYYTRDLFIDQSKPENNSDQVDKEDPFDITRFSDPARRWNTSVFIGIGINLTKKINLGLNYSKNDWIFFGNSFGWEGNYHHYDNDDFSLTAKYTIGK